MCGGDPSFFQAVIRIWVQLIYKRADIPQNMFNVKCLMGYSTDLTDKQWAKIEAVFKSNKGANFVKHSKRDLVNAVLYLVKTSCQWRLLPKDFPPP